MNSLQFNKVEKRLGAKPVLRGIDLSLAEGHVMGLLGKNGAGKTTLLKLSVGLLKCDKGEAQLFEEQAWDMPNDIKERIGYVPQKTELLHWMTTTSLLDYTGSFFKNWDKQFAFKLVKEWELDPKATVSKLSEGQKQRLSIIQAIAHRPDLLILDEPVASLDPGMRRGFIKQVIDMNIDNGTSVLFSTHITSDLERIAGDIALLQKGQIAYEGGLDELKESVVKLNIRAQQTLPDTLPLSNVLRQNVSGANASVTVKRFTPDLLVDLQKQLGAQIDVQQLGLEDIFLEMHQ